MGVSRSLAEFRGKVDRWSARIDNAGEAGVRNAAKAIEEQALANLRDAAGPDLTLSGMNTSKAAIRRLEVGGSPMRGRLGVKTTIVRSGDSGNAEAFVRVTGPAQLVENDVAPHFVYPNEARARGYKTKTRSFATEELTSSGRAKRRRVDIRAVAGSLGQDVVIGRARLRWGNRFLVRTKASSKGRRPWARAIDEVGPQVPGILSKAQADAMRAVFDA